MIAVHHGGDLSAATAAFGKPANGWVDLSTGINPRPWPVDTKVLDGLIYLPDSARIDDLIRAAAAAYGAGDPRHIVPAPGTQALIQWLPRLRRPGRVAIVTPTYGEHAPAWRMAGHEIVETGGLPDPADVDAVVVTNPNNPDGNIVPPGDLTDLGARLAGKGGLLVVDEAFADVDPSASVAASAAAAPAISIDGGVIALRSFGKFFGLPGLRLGFAVTDIETARNISAALGPWPVSSIAAEIGAAALADRHWQSKTRAWLGQAARRVDDILVGAGLRIVGGTDLFRLAETRHAAELYERLGRLGIYTRAFPENPGWLRFGLPGPEEHWNRLQQAMAP